MLTDIAIRKAEPADKPQRLLDDCGLYLEVSPAGGKRWRWNQRIGLCRCAGESPRGDSYRSTFTQRGVNRRAIFLDDDARRQYFPTLH